MVFSNPEILYDGTMLKIIQQNLNANAMRGKPINSKQPFLITYRRFISLIGGAIAEMNFIYFLKQNSAHASLLNFAASCFAFQRKELIPMHGTNY